MRLGIEANRFNKTDSAIIFPSNKSAYMDLVVDIPRTVRDPEKVITIETKISVGFIESAGEETQ
jgi:hypothetical protein